MGVDLEQFHPDNYNVKIKDSVGKESFFLLGVGRLAEKKGFKYYKSNNTIINKK